MSLDNIELNPQLLQQFYKRSLVDIAAEPGALKQPDNIQQPAISYLGNNEKKVLVIADEADAAFLKDNDLALLVGILTACNLSMADIALVNYNRNNSINFSSLNQQFNPTSILLFGIDANKLGFPLLFPHFQLTKYNGQTYIASPGLHQVATDVQLKKQLWAQLQKLFLK